MNPHEEFNLSQLGHVIMAMDGHDGTWTLTLVSTRELMQRIVSLFAFIYIYIVIIYLL